MDAIRLLELPKISICAERIAGLRIPTIDEAWHGLMFARKLLTVAKVARELRLTDHPSLKTLDVVFDKSSWCNRAIDLIREGLYVFDEGYDDLDLQVMPMGINAWCDEDIGNLFDKDGLQEFSKEASLDAFWLLYFNAYAYEDTWAAMIKYFNWPFDGPVDLNFAADRDGVIEYLKNAGHKELIPVVEYTIPRAYEALPAPLRACEAEPIILDFTAENVRLLRKESKDASRIWNKYCKVARQVVWQPELIGVLADALLSTQGKICGSTGKHVKLHPDADESLLEDIGDEDQVQ